MQDNEYIAIFSGCNDEPERLSEIKKIVKSKDLDSLYEYFVFEEYETITDAYFDKKGDLHIFYIEEPQLVIDLIKELLEISNVEVKRNEDGIVYLTDNFHLDTTLFDKNNIIDESTVKVSTADEVAQYAMRFIPLLKNEELVDGEYSRFYNLEEMYENVSPSIDLEELL